LKKNESTIVYEQENGGELKKNEDFSAFQGNAVRLDGKAPSASSKVSKDSKANKESAGSMKSNKEDNERKEEYDPRKHKLQNGVVILKFL